MIAKYVRVSSEGQNNLRQTDFDGKIYSDVCSGSIAFNERVEASKLLANKDITELHVHSIDRLGRNTLNIMQTIQHFTSNGVNVVSEKEGLQTLINGKENPIAKMLTGILGTLAEFELNRLKQRQAEGVKKAREKGVYIGRKAGSSESVDKFLSKESTQNILKYLKQNESIKRTALLSKTSEGKVKKVKKMIRDGLINF